jgi:hypothetical protein
MIGIIADIMFLQGLFGMIGVPILAFFNDDPKEIILRCYLIFATMITISFIIFLFILP